jgi:hypothetical protein
VPTRGLSNEYVEAVDTIIPTHLTRLASMSYGLATPGSDVSDVDQEGDELSVNHRRDKGKERASDSSADDSLQPTLPLLPVSAGVARDRSNVATAINPISHQTPSERRETHRARTAKLAQSVLAHLSGPASKSTSTSLIGEASAGSLPSSSQTGVLSDMHTSTQRSLLSRMSIPGSSDDPGQHGQGTQLS